MSKSNEDYPRIIHTPTYFPDYYGYKRDKRMQKHTIIWALVIIILVCAILMIARRVGAESLDTTRAIVHHSASHDVSVSTIDQWHKERGWKCIGYHFVIRANGDIEKGRPLTMKGAHARGRNQCIGICLTGYDNFTQEQIKSLIKLLKQLKIKVIEPHHEKCPGRGINLADIKNRLAR
jgi:N-acetylmuramoyl-L-alanine amidase